MRKALSGDQAAASQYLGAAATYMMVLKNMMKLGGLSQLSNQIDLPGGVQIQVACVFGQEYVSIYVPEKTTIVMSAPKPVQSQQESARFIYEPAAINDFINKTFTDIILHYENGLAEITRVPLPLVYIGGAVSNTSRNRPPISPVYYTSTYGWHELGLRNSVGNVERRGQVTNLSPDGTLPIGSVDLYDGRPNPIYTNPNTGATTPYGDITQAVVWRTGLYKEGDSDRIGGQTAGTASSSQTVSADNSTVYILSSASSLGSNDGGWYAWDGRHGHGRGKKVAAGTGMAASLTALNGRVVVDRTYYTIDGGTPILWTAGTASYAYCVRATQGPTTYSTIYF